MPCFKPVTAFQPLEGGSLCFSEKKGCREIQIPCGQCIGCRLRKQNAWAVRCMAEAQMHDENWFVTWTYADEHMPLHGSLDYRDMQLTNKKLRHDLGKFRFFVAGEYGDSFGRCHWHSLMFGLRLPDLEVVKTVGDQPIYKSKRLEDAWGRGHVFLGLVTPQSARYCASYTLKKVNGDLAEERYTRVIAETGEIVKVAPEMARMSLRPGIGAAWLEKYWPEVVAHDGVCMNGRVNPMPRYFDKRLRMFDDDALVASIESELDSKRAEGVARAADNLTRERLAVREQCAVARVKFYAER